jgi:twitching motility two-component system response regulator PilG
MTFHMSEPGHPMEKTILIVDDDALICNLLEKLFQRYQLKVITAFDGIEAVTKTREHDPDIILLDIKMPKKDGLTALSEIRAMPRYANIPIIILSAKDQLHEVRAGMDAGATGYLRKPMTAKQITDTVFEYI